MGESDLVRSFIAIELGDAITKSLAQLNDRLRAVNLKGSWTRHENFHITLRFLGKVENQKLDRLGERLDLELQDLSPFPLSVQGVGVFPNERRPAVVWAGLTGDLNRLRKTQAAVERCAQAIGLEPEPQTFSGHVTLARFRKPVEAQALLPALRDEAAFAGGEMTVDHVSLFSSTLTQQGAVYRRLRAVHFPWKSFS